ncbi:MAG: hypothetical protein ACC645_14260 [Pirellulales bacterium]
MSRFHEWFGRTLIDLVASQQAFLSAQFGMAMRVLEVGGASVPGSAPRTVRARTPHLRPTSGQGELGRADKTSPQAESDRISAMVVEAQARMRNGFPPPREIYQVQNRGKIDWTVFPDWARPVSPELYDGCSHEG